MGAWIEIETKDTTEKELKSHPTMGAWIEIRCFLNNNCSCGCRTPRWVRGLKSDDVIYKSRCGMSHPTMGAWIEIPLSLHRYEFLTSHPTMGAWIEIDSPFSSPSKPSCRTPRWVRGLKYPSHRLRNKNFQSHPTMGAWIEIKCIIKFSNAAIVAPHDGCVD